MRRARALTTVLSLLAGGCAPPGTVPASGISLPPRTTASAVSPSAASSCPAAGWDVRTGEVDAAMGLRAMRISLLVCGDRPVPLAGYPAVRLLDEHRRPVPVRARPGVDGFGVPDRFDPGPHPVTLAPGEVGAAGLVWRNTVEGGDPVRAPYLEVIPSPGLPAQIVGVPGGVDTGTTGRLGLAAWTRA